MALRQLITDALDAIERDDDATAKRLIAEARRALGHWGGDPLRSMDAVAVSLATGTRRDTIALSLANAADYLGDGWINVARASLASVLAELGDD